VPAIVRPSARSSGVSKSYRPSAHISPAEGPPIPALEIAISNGNALMSETPTSGSFSPPQGSRSSLTVSGSPSTATSKMSRVPEGAAPIALEASRTEFTDGPEPRQKRHMLRLWLKFSKPWPLAAEFPTHMGYKPAQDTPVLIEAER